MSPTMTNLDPATAEQLLEDLPQAQADPPPPYPASPRRVRRTRRSYIPSNTSTNDGDQPLDASEYTPLLRPRPRRPSLASSVSAAPSLARTILCLFRDSDDEDSNGCDTVDNQEAQQGRDGNAPPFSPQRPRSCALFSGRTWRRYFHPVTSSSYWAPLFHLLVINFPYALLVWVYLFVFTVTGTTLLITLPLGALLCFFDLLGARIFARGELYLQWKFHSPLAYGPPYPSRPLFTRSRPPTAAEIEQGGPRISVPERSFYKNTYSMFTDSTSYQALFYFLVIKPAITVLLSLILLIFVPVAFVLVLPFPAVLRAVRKLGAWQANVAIEGLYLQVS